ncbi:dynein heavy chain, partial [Coemansia spiralis]
MEDVSGDGGGGGPAFLCDPGLVKQYLLDVAGVLLGVSSEEDRGAARAAIATADATDACHSFANDSGVPVLYMMKEVESDSGEQAGYAGSAASFALAFELSWKPTHAGSLALIKRAPAIDPHLPLASQIQVMNLPGPAAGAAAAAAEQGGERAALGASGASPYEALHAYVRFAVSPYFNAYVAAKEKAEQQAAHAAGDVAGGFRDDKDAQQGVPMAKKKLAELELSLLHLQQNVDIPDTVLNIHPVVARTVEACRRQGYRATADAVDPALLGDSGFLNQLQGDANGWIKEIQKVTKLDRDAASGTASQEINFWLSMERALERIEEQLQSDEIVLTMDVLKAAKRFHATVSFRTDTGLKEAAERVTRYNVLMKDFPINELLSATDIGRISHAVEQIFAHVNKKLKLTAYPVRRALPLVEAISRDFNRQLVKVLGHVRLMHMEYGGFDALFGEAQGAFDT